MLFTRRSATVLLNLTTGWETEPIGFHKGQKKTRPGEPTLSPRLQLFQTRAGALFLCIQFLEYLCHGLGDDFCLQVQGDCPKFVVDQDLESFSGEAIGDFALHDGPQLGLAGSHHLLL